MWLRIAQIPPLPTRKWRKKQGIGPTSFMIASGTLGFSKRSLLVRCRVVSISVGLFDKETSEPTISIANL